MAKRMPPPEPRLGTEMWLQAVHDRLGEVVDLLTEQNGLLGRLGERAAEDSGQEGTVELTEPAAPVSKPAAAPRSRTPKAK